MKTMKLAAIGQEVPEIESIKQRTAMFVTHLNRLEKNKENGIRKLKKPKDLKPLLLCLKKEIAILKIAQKEFEFLVQKKKILGTRAWHAKDADFITYYFERIGDIKNVVDEFLTNAQNDARKIEALLNILEGMHDDFYLEYGTKEVRVKVQEIKDGVKRDLRLEQRVGNEDIYAVIRKYLQINPDKDIARLAKTGSTITAVVISLAIGLICVVILGKTVFKRSQPTKAPPRIAHVASAQTNAAPVTQPRVQTQQKPTTPQVTSYKHPSDDFTNDAPEILLARCLFGEAQGCNARSKAIIAATIMYRVRSPSFRNDIQNVILKPKAYSCFNPGDPQYKKIKNPLGFGGNWGQCLQIAQITLTQELPTDIPVAFHYRDSSVLRLGDPYVPVIDVPHGKGGFFHLYVAKGDRLSKNFKVEEFLYEGCKGIRIDQRVINQLENIRTTADKPVKITGIRVEDGIIYVDAVNIIIKGFSNDQMRQFAEEHELRFEGDSIHVQIGGTYLASNINPKTGIKKEVNVNSGDFVSPIQRNYRLSSQFGSRTHPVRGGNNFHNGIDLAAPTGTPVNSIANGTVFAINPNSASAGKLIILQHDNGYMSEYMHLNEILVTNGQRVTTSTIIGKVGSTGRSTGPHLHLGVFKGSGQQGYEQRKNNFVDPLSVIPR